MMQTHKTILVRDGESVDSQRVQEEALAAWAAGYAVEIDFASRLVALADAARITGRQPAELLSAVTDGVLEATESFGKVRFRRDDLEAWAAGT